MSVVIYYEGNAEKAEALRPESGKVRLCNAKYFNAGEFEYVGTRKIPSQGEEPVMFDEVLILAGCSRTAEIEATYAPLNVPVRVVALEKAAPVVAKRQTPADLGWTLSTPPDKYLKRYPNGANAELAAEILEALG